MISPATEKQILRLERQRLLVEVFTAALLAASILLLVSAFCADPESTVLGLFAGIALGWLIRVIISYRSVVKNLSQY